MKQYKKTQAVTGSLEEDFEQVSDSDSDGDDTRTVRFDKTANTYLEYSKNIFNNPPLLSMIRTDMPPAIALRPAIITSPRYKNNKKNRRNLTFTKVRMRPRIPKMEKLTILRTLMNDPNVSYETMILRPNY